MVHNRPQRVGEGQHSRGNTLSVEHARTRKRARERWYYGHAPTNAGRGACLYFAYLSYFFRAKTSRIFCCRKQIADAGHRSVSLLAHRSVSWSVGRSVCQLMHRSVSWSVGLLVGRSVCQLMHRSVSRSVGLLFGRFVCQLMRRSVSWLVGLLVGRSVCPMHRSIYQLFRRRWNDIAAQITPWIPKIIQI